MKRIFPSTQYKKDYKKYRHNPIKKAALRKLLNILIEDNPIPQEYKPHKLQGDYKGCMECHILNDFLLIWIDETKNIIELIRLGSHAELFKK